MKYKAYPKYKNSDVEWLGEIPTYWECKRLGGFFSERREKVSDKDYPALSVTKNGVVPQLDSAAKTDDGENRKKVLKGDFVINSRSDRKGSSGLSVLDGSVSLINTVLIPKNIQGKFVEFLLKSQLFQEEYYKYGKGIVADLWSTNYSEMKNIKLPIPSINEQVIISNFLDHETTKIDQLITKQEKVVELLKEKRQAMISHAVTKGLNHDVKMKDSGVEWLGEVPEHWGVSRIGWLCKVGNGSTPNRDNFSYWDGGNYPWLNSSKVNDDIIVDADQFVTKKALLECSLPLVKKESVIMAITGEGKTRGTSAFMMIDATINQHIAYITPFSKDKISPKYLHVWLQSKYQQIRFESSAGGSTKAAITCSQVKQYYVPMPPLKEQLAIVDAIEDKKHRFNELTVNCELQISLLKERRSALISAAVTGKIDVRGWKPKDIA